MLEFVFIRFRKNIIAHGSENYRNLFCQINIMHTKRHRGNVGFDSNDRAND